MPTSARTSAASRLCLVCPSFADTWLRAPVRLPALERLAAFGSTPSVSIGSEALDLWQSELLQALSLSEARDYPSATLSWLGLYGDVDSGTYFHADPVMLRMSQQGLSLESSAWSARTLAEATQLVNGYLAAEGWQWRVAKDRVFIYRPGRLNVATVTPRHAAKAHLHEAMPRGEDAAVVRKLMTELQMLIHEKLGGGHAPNSMWLWGAGLNSSLPAASLPTAFAEPPFVLGVYRAHGAEVRCMGVPASLSDAVERINDSSILVVLPSLSLQDTESKWFEPALSMIASRRFETIEIYLDGWRVTARYSLFKRWFAKTRSMMDWMKRGVGELESD